EQAAQQLGVHPLGLVAQAALESNWGQSVPRGASGASVTTATQEFERGAAQETRAAFRAYASRGESFQDYVALLQTNPRFSGALGSGPGVASFAAALQRGGYATDPDYARKITAVAGQVAAALKFASDVPITSVPQAPGEESGRG
ncbi:MAG TPA: glucosaminidase domain-containing protein, partial [Candidatus Dormibacteraeota bacterium]|nr:glucosaminidase domain-containing protein [Candidatus Dormibacteraeota bacterium]